MLRVNTFMVTAFVSLHFHTLFCLHCIHLSHHFHSCTIFITFTRLESQFYSLISSVQFNVIVTSAHLHRYSTHRHYHFHWSSFSSVHFYCHLHSHWTCPCGACTGMVKARTGTVLLILCLYRPCMGMERVSLPSRVCFFVLFFVNEWLNGKPPLLSWRHIEHFVVCVYFPTHCYQTASEFREHIALFQ